MDDDRNISMQYRDPITRERKSAVLCPKHEWEALQILSHAGIGCGATYAGALHSCDACRNEDARRDRR